MKRIIGLGFVLAIPVALFADNANDVSKELKALEGKWKAVAMEAGGKPFPKEGVPDFTFIVAADGKSIGQSSQGEYQATITVDPKKGPKTIDNLHESGAQKGKKQYGIYKLEGDKWTVCMTRPGVAEGDRPKDFDTKDTANVVFVFELLKEGSKHQPPAAELQPLQGTWEGVMVGQESGGKITITITGNSLHFHRDTNFWFETTITLPAGTDPQQLHATIKRCAPPESPIGKVVVAIFKIEDETLTLAAGGDGSEGAPKSFETTENQGLTRYELRKVQPQKQNPQPPKTR